MSLSPHCLRQVSTCTSLCSPSLHRASTVQRIAVILFGNQAKNPISKTKKTTSWVALKFVVSMLSCLAPEVGLEPTTLRLTAECSAIELLRNDHEVPGGDFSSTRRFSYNKAAEMGQRHPRNGVSDVRPGWAETAYTIA